MGVSSNAKILSRQVRWDEIPRIFNFQNNRFSKSNPLNQKQSHSRSVSPATTKRRSRGGRAWLLVILVLIVGAGVLVAIKWPRSIRSSSSNVEFGRLPGGVGPHGLNLVVVTLDTTRADRMGAYGYPDAGTPTFDRLAQDGTFFEHASTAAPITLPAHSTLFTGRFPPVHGVRDNGGFYLLSLIHI